MAAEHSGEISEIPFVRSVLPSTFLLDINFVNTQLCTLVYIIDVEGLLVVKNCTAPTKTRKLHDKAVC